MNEPMLAFWMPGIIEVIIVLIIFVVPVIFAIRFFSLMLRNKNENIRLRLEVGKLADELEKVRKQKGAETSDSSRDSG